jgi:hypothetical protein
MRHLYFRLKFKQWFINNQGIKAFAEHCINRFLIHSFRYSSRRNRLNQSLQHKILSSEQKIDELSKYPTVKQDEFANIKSKLRLYITIITICILGETFFNYFAAKAIFTFKGFLAEMGAFVTALILTFAAIYIIELLIGELLLKPKYKQQSSRKRDIPKIIFLFVLFVIYELLIFYIAKIRGMQIEGSHDSGIISTAMIILGMLLPVVAGYYAYERSIYISAYKNTKNIDRLNEIILKARKNIIRNSQQIKNYVQKKLQDSWAILQEFIVYKNNYNSINNVDPENLSDHYCATEPKYKSEGIRRYIDGIKNDILYSHVAHNLTLIEHEISI